ncbi:MAG: hypothetical protein KTR31_04405 [Myxococcales bacterium]|nr:hypothetical protein [Myxococcales bacterium]
MTAAGRGRAILWALVLTGCPYVTQGGFEDRLQSLDEDGDGAPVSMDCDDADPLVSDLMLDIPYDGIDNDCAGDGDVVDADGDGFPGILEEDYPGVFPERFVGVPLDCADDPSVVPQAADIFPDPANANEVPYDGLDSNCDRSNDFDVDGDGFMPTLVRQGADLVDAAAAFDTYVTLWGITEAEIDAWIAASKLPFDDPNRFQDCDDFDVAIRPYSPDQDTPYDGVDRNCDDVNDFDADGDGFMPPGVEADYQAYLDRYYFGGPPPFAVPTERTFEDCLDAANPTIVNFNTGKPADPASVHPSAPGFPIVETAYDAIDADCLRDNDFDADGDAFMPAGSAAGFDVYVDNWSITAAEITAWAAVNADAALKAPAEGDCDDTDGDRWPGALEILADQLDQDCNNDGDAAPFGFADYLWTSPTNPEVGRVADDYVLLIGATDADPIFTVGELGVGIPFDIDEARGGPTPSVATFPTWKGNPLTRLQGVIDAVPHPAPADVDGDGTPDPTLLVGTTYANDFQTWVFLSGVRFQTNTSTLLPADQTFHNLSPIYTARDVDMAFDGAVSPEPFTLACADNRMHAIYTANSPAPNTNALLGADTCYFSGPPTLDDNTWTAPFDRCLGGSCQAWTLDDTPALSQGNNRNETWVFGDYEMGWLVRIDDTGTGWLTDTVGGGDDIELMPGSDVLHADVSETGGTLYVAAIVDGATEPEVWLQFGTKGSLQTQQLPFSHPTLDAVQPSSVAVHADGDRVMVAVTALDPEGDADQDAVGWVFLGP